MKKKKILTLLMALMLTGGMMTSCGPKTKDLTIGTFDVDETKVDSADVLSTYQVTPVSATDNEGTYYLAVITVTDPDGNDVTVTNNSFVCSKMGDYTVTYTVTLNDGDVVSKSYTVRVLDVTEPEIVCSLKEHNITSLGSTFDLSTITATDNSGETVTPTSKVLFNGEELALEGQTTVTFDQKGAYTIEVTASDSSDNVTTTKYNIYTIMDFEHGAYYNNEWYATTISEDFAYEGTHSYEFGAFDSAPNWFNDYSMLGDVYLYETDAKYVSFWIYFDFQRAGFNGSILTNAVYHKLSVYDIYGNVIQKNWQDKYEFFDGNWYRFLVSLDEMEMSGETTDKADAAPVSETLREIPFFFGVWDTDAGAGASKKVYTYLDNIRLVGEVDDEVFKVEEHVFNEGCVADFETESQAVAFTPSWNSTVELATDIVHEGSQSLKFTPYVQWSDIGITGSLNINSFEGYDKLTAWFYAKDESDTSTYDDANVYFMVELRYQDSTILTRNKITTANEWVKLSFTFKGYEDIALDCGDYDICIYKMVNGAPIATGTYDGIAVYLDDIYLETNPVVPPSEFVPGEAQEVNYTMMFDGVMDSTDGWVRTNELADFTIAHGSYTTYEPMTKQGDNLLGSSEENKAYAEGWRFFSGHNDAVIYAVEAKTHMFASLVEPDNISGWIDASANTTLLLAKYDASTDETTILAEGPGVKGSFQSDYIELEEGDRLIFQYKFEWQDYRNVAYPPYWSFAPAVAKVAE